jgi:hypothetical protein
MSKFFPAGVFFFCLSGLFLSCTPRNKERPPDREYPFPQPLAVLEAGENPLWFELAEDGPRQIGFPGEAGLTPFTPWPLARHIRFALPLGDDLILGINREGFLRFAPRNGPGPVSEGGGGIALYRAADAARWGPYTLAALFPFAGRAAALLYRDEFFTASPAPLPAPRAFTLDPDWPAPRPLEIPAFEDFSAAEGWDLDALHAGPGGYWYYRALRKSASQPEIGYYRTGDLDRKGEAVSVTAFQNAALPEPLAVAPPLLRSVLEAAFALGSGGGSAAVVSPGFPGPRRFSGGPDKAGDGFEFPGPELAGFYREPAAGRPGTALAILPGGGGFFHAESPAGADAGTAAPPGPRPLTLPPLPPGFAYTAAALAGDTLFAAWEEQEGYSIGAAGFMAVRITYE